MHDKPATTMASQPEARRDAAPVFGLYYLEEQEFDLNEVVGCFGVNSVGPMQVGYTSTCPYDDWDGDGHVP